MKLFSAGTLLAVALLSALLCVPFSPLLQPAPDTFVLEIRMRSSQPGRVQVYFDRGGGFSERDSSAQALPSGGDVTTLRLPLPPGTYRQLRFDPIDGSGPTEVESLRVTRRDGAVVREVPLDRLAPVHAIETAQIVRGTPSRLHIVPEAAANDPQLITRLEPLLVLDAGWRDWLPVDALRWSMVGGGLLVALAIGRRLASRRKAAPTRKTGRDPATRRILAIAAGAVALSAYPVLFFGASHVSPNHGTPLLYETPPTLPGSTDATLTETMGADTGAIMLQQVPQSVVQASSWRQGEVPVWNRYNSAGTPLLGQGQSMVGDPLHLMLLAANGAAWAWDLKYLLAKWLWAAGLGLVVLRLLRFPPEREPRPPGVGATFLAAAVVSGCAPFIGFFVNRINHPAYFSLCYAPWILYCWLRLMQTVTWRGAAGAAGGLLVANLAVMTSGTAKEAYMLLLALNATGAVLLLGHATDGRTKLLKFALLAWAGALFVLLTAPIWGTFLHDLRHAYTSYNAVKAYQLQPSLFLGLFDEAFHRPVMPGLMTFNPSLNFLLLLGVLYFAATFRRTARSRPVTMLAVLSLLPAALVFGVVPPQWIARVPFLGNVVHIDNTFSCVLIVLWSVLAGVGFATAFRRLGQREGRGDLMVVGLLLLVIVAAWIGFAQAVHRPVYGTAITVNDDAHSLPVSPFLWGYLASLVAAAIVLGVGLRRALAAQRFGIPAAIVCATAALVLCWRHGLHHRAAGFDSYVVQPGPRGSFQAASPAVQFLQAARQREPARVYGLGANLFPGWNAAYRLETIHGPDALMNGRYRELVSAMQPIERVWDWRLSVAPGDLPAALPFLDALNVRYYVTTRAGSPVLPRALPRVFSADLDVHESTTAWPRAFFTDRVFVYERVDDLIAALRAGPGPCAGFSRDDATEILRLGLARPNWDNRGFAAAGKYALTESTTRFSVQANGPGIIVLTEANWPGDVRVYANGAKQPLLRVNHAFIGLPVTAAGTYDVEVRYVPKGWYRNLGLAATGLLLAAITAGVVVVSERRRGPGRGGIVLARNDKSFGSYVRQ